MASSVAIVSEKNSDTITVTLSEASGSREGILIYNDSTAVLRVKFGAGAATDDYSFQIVADGYYESFLDSYTGIVTGIWEAANGSARVTELRS